MTHAPSCVDWTGLCLIFDLDGVILDSEATKTAAFRTLFADSVVADEIDSYNRSHRGIPRRDKFVYVLEQLLGVQPDEGLLDQLSRRYADLLAAAPPTALIPGVGPFLRSISTKCELYVASSAPQEEVIASLKSHGLFQHFTRIYGHPTSKRDALVGIRASASTSCVIFIGDAPADRSAARDACVAFIGVAAGSPAWAKGVPTIPDFTYPDRLAEAVRLALK